MKNSMFKDFDQVKAELKVLVDGGENLEYTRGALEIVSSFISYHKDTSHSDNVLILANEIGLSSEVIDKLY